MLTLEPLVVNPLVYIAPPLIIGFIAFGVTYLYERQSYGTAWRLAPSITAFLLMAIVSSLFSWMAYDTQQAEYHRTLIHEHYEIDSLSEYRGGATTIMFRQDDKLYVVDGYLYFKDNEVALYTSGENQQKSLFNVDDIVNNGKATSASTFDK